MKLTLLPPKPAPGCDRTWRPAVRRRRSLVRSAVGVVGFGACSSCLVAANAAAAQTVLIQPAIDPEFNRGRNLSVTEQARPDYDALGIPLGSFVVRPAVTIAAVATSNVYLDDSNKKGDIYASIQPFLTVDSNWSVHRLGLIAAGDLRRYASQSLKNQNAWYVYGQGRLDIRSNANVLIDAQIDRSVESPYFEDIIANLVVPSTYLRRFVSIKGTYTPGRTRLIGAIDVSDFTFNTIAFADGRTRDQRFRNRAVYRAAGIYEYGLSPSLSVYGQATYDSTNYGIPLPNGVPNRDSKAYSFSVGSNFDLAGLARGSIGIGFSRRRYSAIQVYAPAQGISGQAKVEFFPSALYTVTLLAQRQLQDVNLGNSGAYWNNLLSLGVDHDILVNVIVSANVQLIRRDYLELGSHSDVYQGSASARYQASRQLGFNAELSYGASNPVGSGLGNPFHELRATIGIRIRD